jgi:hypothetical protein
MSVPPEGSPADVIPLLRVNEEYVSMSREIPRFLEESNQITEVEA